MKVRHWAILLFLLAVVAIHWLVHEEDATLNLLVWRAMPIPRSFKAFEEQHHCKVSAS